MIVIEINNIQATYDTDQNKWFTLDISLAKTLNKICVLDFEEYGPSLVYKTNGIDGEVLKLVKISFKQIKVIAFNPPASPIEQEGIVV